MLITDYMRILKVLNKEQYVDLVFDKSNIVVDEFLMPNVFVNLTKDGNNVELLFFISIKNLEDIDQFFLKLRVWSLEFMSNTGFLKFVCYMDNFEDEGFVFDSNS